jgi:hypothetical protein
MEELTTLILSITGSFIAIWLYFKSIEFKGNIKFRQQLKEQAARHKKERDQQKEELKNQLKEFLKSWFELQQKKGP